MPNKIWRIIFCRNCNQKLEFHSWDEFHDHIKQEIDALNSKPQIPLENFSTTKLNEGDV